MKKKKLFRLVSDDDGHWYVIPADKSNEFDKAVMDFENSGALPDWAEALNGSISRVIFSDYSIG